MRIVAVACLICIYDSRRVQTRVREEDEGDSFQDQHNSYSLVELSQSASKVAETLKSDFANIFWKEPHWNIFADNFNVIDLTGAPGGPQFNGALYGMDENTKAARLIRRMYKYFFVSEFKVDFVERKTVVSEWRNQRFRDESQEPLDGEMIAAWSVELTQKAARSGKQGEPILIEAQTLFYIHNMTKVSIAKITMVMVNGVRIMPMPWPDVDFEDSDNLKNVNEWVEQLRSIVQSVIHKDGFVESGSGIGEFPTEDINGYSKAIASFKGEYAKQFLQDHQTEIPEKVVIKSANIMYSEMITSISAWKDGKFIRKMQEPLFPYILTNWKMDMMDLNTTKRWFQFWKKNPTWALEGSMVFVLMSTQEFSAYSGESMPDQPGHVLVAMSMNEFQAYQSHAPNFAFQELPRQ
jgi:hypothetical protein